MAVRVFDRIETPMNNQEKVTQSLKNLSSAVPADATALYLAGLQIVNSKSALETGIVFGVGFLFMLFIRIYTKAGLNVTLTSIVAYLIWAYAIGGGFFQALGLDLGNIGAFLVVVYSAVAMYLANTKS